MKSLIVFYSRTGNTRKLAEKISSKLNADIEEIKDLKDRTGPLNFFRSGKDALYEKTTTIVKPSKNYQDYDLVIIGTPIWASNISIPIRSYILNKNFKKVAFFCTTGGTGIDKCFKKMEDICGKPLATLGLSSKELEDIEKINNFVNKLK